jgi:hypothetical protein
MVAMSERKSPLKRLRYEWIEPGDIGWGLLDWIDLAQNKDRRRALVNTVGTF